MPQTERIRSPREARRRIDEAGARIARDRDRWVEIVNGVRSSLGHEPLFAEDTDPAAVDFITTDFDEVPAAYPTKRLRALDSGGMNSVLRSWELFTGRELTVRRHLPSKSAVEEFQRMHRNGVVRERLQGLPRHVVIPRFWLSGIAENRPCEVFDFAPGVNLRKYVTERGLTLGQLLDFGTRAASALAHLHRHGLIHADVKMENFCVEERILSGGDPSLRVSLIDFDIVSSPEDQIRQYRLGDALEGTLPFMPPENFLRWVPDDPAEAERMMFSKDVFAFGLTIARVVAGQFPDGLYGEVSEVVSRKAQMEELDLDLPSALPAPLRLLVEKMCAARWEERPAMPEVVSTLRDVRASLSDDDRRFALVPSATPEPRPEARPKAAEDRVGPFRVRSRTFSPRPPGDRQSLPLAELEDYFGRRLIGVPFEFGSVEEESAFYGDRCSVLLGLNKVRLENPALFAGSFRDLVREEKDGRYQVWIVRPLLLGAKDLRRFLSEERPDAGPVDRVAILRRTAEALAVLEEASFTHPGVSCETIFFVPVSAEPDGTSEATASLTRPVSLTEALRSTRSAKTYRQELMGTAFVTARAPALADPAVAGLLAVANEIDVFRDLLPDEKDRLLRIRQVPTWRERAGIIGDVESACSVRPISGIFRPIT